ncbi:MAG: hypothetical protein ACI8PT_001560 [Gammaproteobacteria bacterium]|jgi:hypothetical protein
MKRFVAKMPTLLTLSLVILALGHPPGASAKRIKCWTNDEGVRECGNVVPPKYAQRGYQSVNQQGVVIGRERRAKTPEELAVERRLNAQKKAQEQETERLARLQETKDRVLLDTFTTEEDLVLAHKGRLAAIDSRLTHTKQIVSVLKGDLTGLERTAAEQERSGKLVSRETENKIADTQRQITQQRQFVSDRHNEKSDLDEQFKKDVARYRELKGT